MSPALIAILPQLISALPQVTTGFMDLFNFIRTVRTAGKPTGEWSAEMEAKFNEALLERVTMTAYLTDAQLATRN